MNRILFHADEVGADGGVVLRDERAAHIRTVLRAEPGSALRIGVVDGPCGEGVVRAVGEDVTLDCVLENGVSRRPCTSLLLALPRPKVMRRLWAPLASLGLDRIVLVNASRVEREYFDTHWLAPETYEPLLIEGLQQAGLTHRPRVQVERRLKPWIEDALDGAFPAVRRLVADPAAATALRDVPLTMLDPVLLAVGPEGGWVPFELELLAQAGFTSVSVPLGTLRTDVACTALLAILAACRNG